MTAQAPTVLVINAGSSSLKFRLLELVPGRTPVTRVRGNIERIGLEGGDAPDHEGAMDLALAGLDRPSIDAVGHRVVHGGMDFTEPTLIDDDVERGIDKLAELAPLHNPAGLAGIRAARLALPEVPHVAVFDTAFHSSIPPVAHTYAIDRDVATRFGIRRYGFHGTSYSYVTARAADLLGRDPAELRLVILHLGNGASAAAVRDGRSIDTSMGLTPLEGLVMGTRSGDIDPAALLHLARVGGYSTEQLDDLLNRRSGLLGLSGHSDMRAVIAAVDAGSEDAALALEVYLHRIRRYIGAYAAELGGVDAIVFTAGVGENNARVRAGAVRDLDFLGITLDAAANDSPSSEERIVSAPGAGVAVLVIPTDEELEIARETLMVTVDAPERIPDRR